MKKIKIYLVDDHALFREGLRFLLTNLDFVEEIYEAENGQQFISGLRLTLRISHCWISKCL